VAAKHVSTGVGPSQVLVIARNALGKGGQNRGNICVFVGKRREIEGRAWREVRRWKGGGGGPDFGHVGADAQTGRQMAPELPHFPSPRCGTLVRHHPRQEPSALAAHAGICAGGAG
jgi:hypothetical protein